MFLLNKLKSADLYFFIAIGAIILICVLIYFLIPVFKRKQYEEQRQNLKKREATFRANLKKLNSDNVVELNNEEEPEAQEALDINGE